MNPSKIPVVTICPGCLDRYPPNSIYADYPICPDCNSEAMEIEVIPYEDFMSRLSLSDLEQMKQRLSCRHDLLPKYKQGVLNRMDEIIPRKEALRGSSPVSVFSS